MTKEDKIAKTCELVASALGEVKSDYQDPNRVHVEIGTTKRTPATDLLQEHSGDVVTDRVKALAARCATCGPLSAAASYTMEHFLINKTFGSDSQVKKGLEGEPGILQSTDLSPTTSSWTATGDGKRRLTNSRSESALLTTRNTRATSSTGWNQGYQGQR